MSIYGPFADYCTPMLSGVTGEKKITVCRSPKSGANFFALGNFDEQVAAAYDRAQSSIALARAPRAAPAASIMPMFAWMHAAQ